MKTILKKIEKNEDLTRDDLIRLLGLTNIDDIVTLYSMAYKRKLEEVGRKVYFRGIIELSNICEKDCYYCGIRKSNKKIKRFQMSKDEIIESSIWAYENNYGSIVLQAGELQSAKFADFIENILLEIKTTTTITSLSNSFIIFAIF